MINKRALAIMLSMVAGTLFAAEVTIIVKSIPPNTPEGAQIYIAGSFNHWNPGSSDYMLEANEDGHPEISVEGTGTITFKFTRGSWASVEGNVNGGFLPNRSFIYGSADTLEVNILSWEDTGGTNSTAAENVVIMTTSFQMPQFERTRRIWLYLPPDYDTSGLSYPVLYMHDGQNLFDQATAFAGEWEVDETLNGLFEQGKSVPIVVGIDNGGTHRIAEYTPWANSQYGGGDGDLYADFIVETLKPYIDENYRTLPARENTGVMGSSLGGLISFYIAHKHQDVFSKAGVFSPSFWFSDAVYAFASETGKLHPMKYYIMGGTSESGGLVGQMEAMVDTLFAIGFEENEVELTVISGGQHNEALWRSQFRQSYEWLFFSGATSASDLKMQDRLQIRQAGNRFWLEPADANQANSEYSIQVFSISGQKLFSGKMVSGQAITLPSHLKGIFVARIFNYREQATEKIWLP